MTTFDRAWDISKEDDDMEDCECITTDMSGNCLHCLRTPEEQAKKDGRAMRYEDSEEYKKDNQTKKKSLDTFDSAWGIVKEERDYSKFGEKLAEKLKKLREGGRGLPEGTKFSDLRSTSDIYSGAGADKGMPFAMRPHSKKYPMDAPKLPSILDLGPSHMMPEEPNMKILREIMGQDTSDDAIDEMDRIREQQRMGAESAKMRGHVNIPDSLINRVRRAGRTPKDD